MGMYLWLHFQPQHGRFQGRRGLYGYRTWPGPFCFSLPLRVAFLNLLDSLTLLSLMTDTWSLTLTLPGNSGDYGEASVLQADFPSGQMKALMRR